jgi:hypothetical protein
MKPEQYVVTTNGGYKLGNPVGFAKVVQRVRDEMHRQRHLFVKDWLDNTLEITVLQPVAFTQHVRGISGPPTWMAEMQRNLTQGAA